MTNAPIRIGTRGSQLALYQAERVKTEILARYPEKQVDIEIIKTKGDKILDVALSKIGDKGLFTKELEIALLENRVDICVHSLKDLATDVPKGLKLGAVLKRGEYRDALVHKDGKKLRELTKDDVIATSSLRRIAGLKKLNPDIQVVDIRGNVNTRLQKMENGHCDGMIMAAAGLQRLGFDAYISEIIAPTDIIPAVAQGAIAIESRMGDQRTDSILEKLNDSNTLNAVIAERKFLNTLQGGCQVPVGCYSEVENGQFKLTGFVASLDASEYLKESIEGDIANGTELAHTLAEKLINRGGDRILQEIRSQNNN